MRGDSKDPTLLEGDLILFARRRARRRHDHVFESQTADGPVLSRTLDTDGDWQLMSEHPALIPMPLPDDSGALGQVVSAAGARSDGATAWRVITLGPRRLF